MSILTLKRLREMRQAIEFQMNDEKEAYDKCMKTCSNEEKIQATAMHNMMKKMHQSTLDNILKEEVKLLKKKKLSKPKTINKQNLSNRIKETKVETYSFCNKENSSNRILEPKIETS